MILVFGQKGQVATELARQAPVLTLGRAQADLMMPGTAAEAIAAHAPRAVINAAAYTAVDKAQEDAASAHRLNADAPGEMARTCAHRDIPLLHVSTDYVFDGSGTAPFTPDATTAPLGVYGQTKLAGEAAIRAAAGPHLILRTSWVFSAHGTNFVKTMLRLSQTRDHLSVVADQIGGPTPAADIAATLLTLAQAMTEGARGGTYHYAGAPAVSWADFARTIFATAGREVHVEDIPSSTYPTPARRPLNSRLNCTQMATDFDINQPSWQDGLLQVLHELEA